MAQHTINLPCIADTYVDSENPYTNYGSLQQAVVAYKHYSPGIIKTALLKFNKSSLPQHVKIVKTTLKLYVINKIIGSGETPVITCRGRLLSEGDFDEYIVTYDMDSGHPWPVLRELSVVSIGNYQDFVLDTNYNVYTHIGLKLGVDNSYDNVSSMTFSTRESSNPPILEVIYEDVPPSAPTPIEPIGLYMDSRAIIRFEWQYNSDVGGEQKTFDLQYSTDQTNWTTVSETTANNYYDMPADTLPAGNIYWRVRCYNEYDEAGPYCEIQSFYAVGAPGTPALNTVPVNTARPTITWSAFNQQGYQLQVISGDDIVYDSGIVPGINIRSHKVAAWLTDGSYTAKVRIKNEYDLWSAWGEASFAIATTKPAKPTIDLQRSAHGVEINATGLVYRSDYSKDDYICIGEASGTYYDNTVRSKGEYKYFVRAVSEDDTYRDSDIKFIQADFRHALIAPASDTTNVFAFTRSLNTPPKRTYSRQPGGAFVEYAGRKAPVWEPTEHATTGWAMDFYLKTWADVERFTAIYDLNGTVLYRDSKGRKMYGILSNLLVNDERGGYTVSFTLNQVDHNEELEV